MGAVAELTVNFYNDTCVLNDPTIVTLTVMAPDGSETVYSVPPIVRDSTGVYHYDLALTEAGLYRYRWAASGNITAVQEGVLSVSPSSLIAPSPIDLTTVALVQQWLNDNSIPSVGGTENIQQCITSASMYWLNKTGQDNGDGAVPTGSPFVTPQPYNEWYDGNGNDRLFLLHRPVRSISLLQVNGVTIPASSSFNTPGWVIDQNKKSIVVRSSGGLGNGVGYGYGPYYGSRFGPVYYFVNGTQNIQVQYTAGYSATPGDIVDAITRMVALNHNRMRWLDQKQNATPDAMGTITYQSWELEPYVQSILRSYTRIAA